MSAASDQRIDVAARILAAMIAATPFERREEIDRVRAAKIAVECADELIKAANRV